MEFQNLTYLLLLLVYLIIPVILRSQKSVPFLVRLKYIFPAIVFIGAIFGMWNRRFIASAIWSFNPAFLTGIEIMQVPVEEWLSFLIIPLSSAYIYEWLKIKFERFEKANFFVALSLAVFIISGVSTYIFRQNLVSFFTFFLTSIYLGYTIFRNLFKNYFTKFYLTYFVILIPFFLLSFVVNKLSVINYNPDQITGFRFAGVPIERFVYLYLMLMFTITIYEFLKNRRYY